MSARALIAAALAASVPACSIVANDSLSRGYRPEQQPDCHAHVVPIVGDIAVATVSVAGLGLVTWDEDGWRSGDSEDRKGAANLVGTAVAAAVSAAWGVRQMRRCDAAFAAHERWVAERAWGRAAVAGEPEPAPPDASTAPAGEAEPPARPLPGSPRAASSSLEPPGGSASFSMVEHGFPALRPQEPP